MADPFCRICGAPAVEGSTLCKQHRAQALSFASSLVTAKADHAPAASPSTGPAAGGPSAPLSAPAPIVAAAPPRDPLREEITRGLAPLLAWQAQRSAHDRRWPQLALYVLRGEVVANHYFGVAPLDGEPKPFDLDAPPLREALAAGGAIVELASQAFAERRDALAKGDVQLLSIDFRWHEGRIVVCEKQNGQPRKELGAFAIDGATLVRRDA